MNETLNTVATYWTIAVWFIGIAFITVIALLGLSMATWKLYRHIVGWPVIFKALRQYRDRRTGEGDESAEES